MISFQLMFQNELGTANDFIHPKPSRLIVVTVNLHIINQ
jgi:hypothetical protein